LTTRDATDERIIKCVLVAQKHATKFRDSTVPFKHLNLMPWLNKEHKSFRRAFHKMACRKSMALFACVPTIPNRRKWTIDAPLYAKPLSYHSALWRCKPFQHDFAKTDSCSSYAICEDRGKPCLGLVRTIDQPVRPVACY
jgi:hypothetical protein